MTEAEFIAGWKLLLQASAWRHALERAGFRVLRPEECLSPAAQPDPQPLHRYV